MNSPTTRNNEPAHQWADVLLDVVDRLRAMIQEGRAGQGGWATPVAQEGGDTIYAIDRDVEAILLDQLSRAADELGSIELIAEGLGRDGRMRLGREGPIAAHLIIDPIDGTRNLMYDKRSAWFLAALVPAGQPGSSTSEPRLTRSILSIAAELPTSKAGWIDTFIAIRPDGLRALRSRVDGGKAKPIPVRPSESDTLEHGWAQVSNFFPGTKVLASQLMERIADRVMGERRPGESLIFDDQYLSTGGQMVELACGRDRFCCDLRPLFYDIAWQRLGAGRQRGLECHPYDLAGWMVAQQAGVILTDGWGRPLDAPLDVQSPVHWCGYANARIRERVEPVIHEFLREHNLQPPNT
ncbi:MAG: hypothetical protein JJU36_17390 [Phycisphaeraceae bacterium]|nr:hypothetical protein [Phycisphaeraceae bacterium]